jgi:hypothetical protein
VACLPALVTYSLITYHLDAQLTHFIPHEWNDQTGFWHYILTFKVAGFDGGYYALNERLAALDFARFDVKGPAYPMLLGSVARLTGWEAYTPIYFNMAMIGIASLIFLQVIRANRLQSALLGLLLLTFWVILMYIPTSSQESFHHAGALVSAACFYQLLQPESPSPATKVSAFLCILLLSLVRFSWALLFIPLFILLIPSPRRTWLTSLLASGVASAFILGSMLFASYTNTPSTNAVLVGAGDLLTQPWQLAEPLWNNIESLISNSSLSRYQFIQMIGVIAGLGFMLYWRRKRPDAAAVKPTEWLLHSYIIGSIAALSFLLYLPEGYFRIFGIYLFFSFVLLLASQRYHLIGILVVGNLVGLPSFLQDYQQWQPNFQFDMAQQADWKEAVHTYITYQPDAPSPWCNTLFLPVRDYDYRVLLIPGGVGIAWYWQGGVLAENRQLQAPLRSFYFLLHPQDYADLQQNFPPFRAELVASLPIGNLYYNSAADCPSPLARFPASDTVTEGQLGLNEAQDADYQALKPSITLVESQTAILNPYQSSYGLTREQQIAFWSEYLNQHQVSRSDRKALFTLLALWEQTQDITSLSEDALQELDPWRASKSAADLQAAGYDYVLVSPLWATFLSLQERQTLETEYTLIATVQDPITLASYSLYQAK